MSNKRRVYYLEGECKINEGTIEFKSVLCAVSQSQAWYYTIVSLRKHYRIDYLIHPELSFIDTYANVFNKKGRSSESTPKLYFEHRLMNDEESYKEYRMGEVFRPFTNLKNIHKLPQYVIEKNDTELMIKLMIEQAVKIKNDIITFINNEEVDREKVSKYHKNIKKLLNSATWTKNDIINLNKFILELKKSIDTLSWHMNNDPLIKGTIRLFEMYIDDVNRIIENVCNNKSFKLSI